MALNFETNINIGPSFCFVYLKKLQIMLMKHYAPNICEPIQCRCKTQNDKFGGKAVVLV